MYIEAAKHEAVAMCQSAQMSWLIAWTTSYVKSTEIYWVYYLSEANAMAEAANVAPANANGEEGDQGRDRIECPV